MLLLTVLIFSCFLLDWIADQVDKATRRFSRESKALPSDETVERAARAVHSEWNHEDGTCFVVVRGGECKPSPEDYRDARAALEAAIRGRT